MDIRKLQKAIVGGLDDVKGQNIVVFNTEALSALFERVIIASGTSNRQTKALAASVRDAVKALGEPAPRVEGEENGEWIIVDCGAAVAHIMQPAIRDYYNLEEIWGMKPVALKSAVRKARAGLPKAEEVEAPKAPAPARKVTPAKSSAPRAAAKTAAKTASKTGSRAAASAKSAAPAKTAKASSASTAKKRAPAAKTAGAAPAKKSAAKPAARKRAV